MIGSPAAGRSPLLALLVVWFLASCASSRMAASPAAALSSPQQANAELTDLERQIEASRLALGLSPRPAMMGQTDRDAQPIAEDQATPRAPAPAPPAKVTESLSGGTSSETAGVETATCQADPCRYTAAICRAASRICEIARYLGDSEAESRCRRAQQDCAEARQATRDRCPGC